MSSIKEISYESEFLNEHLGDLRFGYMKFNIVKIENVNALSKKEKYTNIKVQKVVTSNWKVYDIKEWIRLVELKVKELKEEFIVEELVKRQKGLIFNAHEKEENIYLNALKIFTYRTWERATDPTVYFLTDESRNSWIDFNSMLETKYPKQMKNRLINQTN